MEQHFFFWLCQRGGGQRETWDFLQKTYQGAGDVHRVSCHGDRLRV